MFNVISTNASFYLNQVHNSKMQNRVSKRRRLLLLKTRIDPSDNMIRKHSSRIHSNLGRFFCPTTVHTNVYRKSTILGLFFLTDSPNTLEGYKKRDLFTWGNSFLMSDLDTNIFTPKTPLVLPSLCRNSNVTAKLSNSLVKEENHVGTA